MIELGFSITFTNQPNRVREPELHSIANMKHNPFRLVNLMISANESHHIELAIGYQKMIFLLNIRVEMQQL